jgi:chromosome segregation ATPase
LVHPLEGPARWTFEAKPGIKSKARPKVSELTQLADGMRSLAARRTALRQIEARCSQARDEIATTAEARQQRCERLRPVGELHSRVHALRRQVADTQAHQVAAEADIRERTKKLKRQSAEVLKAVQSLHSADARRKEVHPL